MADYLIRKRGAWYRPKAAGYTDSLAEAGVFTESEARLHHNELECVTIHRTVDLLGEINEQRSSLERQLEQLDRIATRFGEV